MAREGKHFIDYQNDVTAADVQANWEKLGEPVNRRSRHVVGEISRTIAAAADYFFTGKVRGSLAALALGALPALKDTQALVLLAGDAQGAAETVVLYLGLALIDLSCLAILATGREKPRT